MRSEKAWRWALVAALGLVAAGLWRTGSQSASAERAMLAPGCCVATLDLNTVMEALDERKEREKELEAYIREREAKLQDLAKNGQTMQSDLKLLTKGTPEYLAKREELVRLNGQFQVEGELSKKLVEEKRKQMRLALFEKIKASAEKIAKAQGISVLISSDASVEIPDDASENSVQGAILSRRVLFQDPSIDLSDVVSKAMNNEFKARG